MEGLRELVLLDEMFAQCLLHVEVITASCQVRVVTVDSCHWQTSQPPGSVYSESNPFSQ